MAWPDAVGVACPVLGAWKWRATARMARILTLARGFVGVREGADCYCLYDDNDSSP
jgi:hypothetical protein